MTRYPASGKGNNWTVLELKAITALWKGDSVADGGGLTGEVRVSGGSHVTVPFKFAFKWNGKVSWHYCGIYPQNSMATIRKIRDEARASVRTGIDPRAKKISDRIIEQEMVQAKIAEAKQKKINAEAEIAKNLTFQDLFDVWIVDGVSRADGNLSIKMIFKKHALPSLAKIPVSKISDGDLLKVYRTIANQSKYRTAVMLSKDIGQMLRWAEKRQPWRVLMLNGNPSELVDIEKLLPSDYQEERERYLSHDEIRKLKSIFTEGEVAYKKALNKYEVTRPLIKETQIALWLCLSTLCRIGEQLMTEWKHVDFEARTWIIPKENVKGTRRNKQEQLVYLSEFSLAQFKQLHAITGESKWAFPAAVNSKKHNNNHVCVKSVSKQVGDRQTQFKQRTKELSKRVNNNNLVLGMEDWTPHDLRRTGSTMMQELGISLDVIDRCQNHVLAGARVRRHYLHHEYADEKRKAWHMLGKRLDAILKSSNGTSLKIHNSKNEYKVITS